MKPLHCFALACVLSIPAFSQKDDLKNGDIIFIQNKEIKGKNLLPNGKGKFNYVGIVFIEKNEPMVYHAMQPLSKCTVDDFLKLSEGNVVVKHLAEEELLTQDVVNTMHNFAEAKIGSAYDNSLKLTNEKMYNAEFVWQVYQAGIGLPLCIPREIKDYKVESPMAIEFLTDAYGAEILDEKIVAIGDIFQSQFLE